MDRRVFLHHAAMAAMLAMSGFPLGEAAKAAPLGRVKELGVLRVAVYRDNRPWSWRKDGRLVGIDVDLAQALAKGLGVRADIAELVADESADDDLRNGVWRGGLLGFPGLGLWIALVPTLVRVSGPRSPTARRPRWSCAARTTSCSSTPCRSS